MCYLVFLWRGKYLDCFLMADCLKIDVGVVAVHTYRVKTEVNGKAGSIRYSCSWWRCSSPSRLPFEYVVGDNPLTRHRASVTVCLPQVSPGTYLSTIPKGRMISWVGCTPTAQPGTRTQARRFVVRGANHCTAETYRRRDKVYQNCLYGCPAVSWWGHIGVAIHLRRGSCSQAD